jgi:protein-L-isoaspartate(D-aspartate) O-methyltransferase
MVARHIEARGVRDPAVLAALRQVPREEFVAPALRYRAYDDTPLPIEDGQTISQPYIVALMLEAASARPGGPGARDRRRLGLRERGASLIAARVVAIERHAGLAASAAERLARLGFAKVEVHHADGSGGWPDAAPFDAILVAASGPRVPGGVARPARRRRAARHAGRLLELAPAAGAHHRRGDAAFDEEDLGGVVFVPLVGEHGWPAR